ncbi:Uncharacterised protein [Actinomyces bovis]|uniref:Uncharacterized protein n=1 Tax=Actinomyces bovis TaxID=1658 RepID=A0ABY1VP46_9ACTO|nr:hypothetical protein [Actinomyces bovis]SPT53217.1 Uncharacterised protein [Actinomyces bovis]
MMMNRRMFLGGTASVAVLTALAACAKTSDGKGSSGGGGSASALNTKNRSELQEGAPSSSRFPPPFPTGTIAMWTATA